MWSKTQKIAILVTFVLILLILSLSGFAEAAVDFKFIVLGDSQLNNPEIFENIIREVELLKPAFVVQVGDMIQGYSYVETQLQAEWEVFKKQIAPLTMPFYPVPGNHDVCTPPAEKVYGQVWGTDKYYYSFDYENCHFIILDAYYKGLIDEFNDKQIKWLKDDLKAHAPAVNIFVFLHPPLFRSKPDYWAPIHEELKKYRVQAVLAGHTHDQHYFRKDNIDYITVNSSGNMSYYYRQFGRFFHYLVVSVQEGQVSFALVEAKSVFPLDLVSAKDRKNSSTWLDKNDTLITPDPLQAPLDLSIEVPLNNRTQETRAYTLDWQIPEERWQISPLKKVVKLAPGASSMVPFHVKVPMAEYKRHKFPYCNIISPYIISTGEMVELTQRISLFAPPGVVAVRTQEPPKIDGKLEDRAWGIVEPLTNFVVDEQGTLAPEQTWVKFLYDDKYLYVGIKGEEPNPKGLRANAAGSIPFVWDDDDFELFLDTNRDKSTYFRFMINSVGTTLSRSPSGLYQGQYQAVPFIGKDYWSVEYRISWDELKVSPAKKGTVWGINVRRHRHQARPAESDWSKMGPFPYNPEYFGLLKFQ